MFKGRNTVICHPGPGVWRMNTSGELCMSIELNPEVNKGANRWYFLLLIGCPFIFCTVSLMICSPFVIDFCTPIRSQKRQWEWDPPRCSPSFWQIWNGSLHACICVCCTNGICPFWRSAYHEDNKVLQSELALPVARVCVDAGFTQLSKRLLEISNMWAHPMGQWIRSEAHRALADLLLLSECETPSHMEHS